ncbi:MAG: hypothetical protein ACNA7E_08595 [Wenzhouxiangellaceae bacterium]
MYTRFLLILITSFALTGFTAPVLAQGGPPDRICILLGMLGAPCEAEEEGGTDAGPAPNSAGAAYVSHADVFFLLDVTDERFFTIVPRSSSTLVRNATGLTGSMSLAQQLPNQATTMWWVIFNHPEHCETTPCTFDDFAIPEVEGAFFTTGGRVSNRWGEIDLHGQVFAGAGRPGPAEPEGLGVGLTNPMGAEVQLISRTHGRDADELAELGMLEDALSTLFGGECPFDALDPEEPNPHGCQDATLSFHMP